MRTFKIVTMTLLMICGSPSFAGTKKAAEKREANTESKEKFLDAIDERLEKIEDQLEEVQDRAKGDSFKDDANVVKAVSFAEGKFEEATSMYEKLKDVDPNQLAPKKDIMERKLVEVNKAISDAKNVMAAH